ncbi:hypothetical protein CL634_11735 [bacterium]|nr:hypothetical protein [bacterium]|tara:strand:- start:209 stop:646 length:438 start_codon:yes stop_codon:yes gene_type:complete
MKNQHEFGLDDLIAVFGGSIAQDGKKAQQVLICKVIAIGEQDLFVFETNKKLFGRSIFKVPQSICVKLFIDPDRVIHDRILEPRLGDLVLSLTWDKYKEDAPEQTTGILYKIFYKRGKAEKCSLLRNNEFEEVLFDNLIVLQKKS